MQSRRSSIHAGGKYPPCVDDADERGRRLERQRLLDGRDDRHAVLRLRRRASSRGSRRRRRAGSAARRASSCRSAGRPRSPQRAAGTCMDTEARLLRRKLDAVDERDARPRVVREQEVAVEVDVVEERRDLRAGRDPEPRLDHAAEHAAEPERARGVHHPHRLADPARLRELDVDPVRALGARGDVGERVAVLVDVDRNRRALLQLRARRRRRRAAAARSTRRRARRAAGGRRAPRRGSTPRSRRPAAGGRRRRRARRGRARRRARRGRRA